MENLKKVRAFLTGYNAYFLFLTAIAVGLPLSKFLMSLGTLCILGQWLLDGKLIQKFSTFFNNRIALICSATFLVFLLGLIHTQNLDYGIKDLRIKLPLLTFPVILSTFHKLKKNHLKILLLLFASATLVSTLYGFLAYHEILPAKKEINEIRDISQFISHIRLSLMVVLSMFILPIFLKDNWLLKLFGMASFLWFAYFLSLIESATGLLIGGVTLCVVSFYWSITRKSIVSLVPVVLILIIGTTISIKLYSTYNRLKIDTSKMEEKTASGNLYDTNIDYKVFDNGNFSDDYLCEKELKETWNQISDYNYSGLDKNGKAIRFILIRYLTSKGKRKDKEGVLSLSKKDIENIENSIPNYLYTSRDLMSRLSRLMFEIDGSYSGANPNGNSLAQRLEYWKTSKEIVKGKFLFGHGTGDVAEAFKAQYKTETDLTQQYQLRSHNQYLSTFIAVGFIGVFIFILSLVLPLQYALKRKNYLYLVFASITLLSFLSEDTLETQDGVFLFAFFNSLFLFQIPKSMLKRIR